jgi:hypothetical protein
VGGLGASFGSGSGGGPGSASSEWMAQYVRRLWAWEQMDFESCFDQMVTLLGPSPSTVKNRAKRSCQARPSKQPRACAGAGHRHTCRVSFRL